MLELFQQLIADFLASSALTALVPANNIMVGPVDITMENQASLLYPSIILSLSSESFRSVPSNTRDTLITIDIYSRNSQLEVENIYEQLVLITNYVSGPQGSAFVFWQKMAGAVDMFESDRRVWHRSCTMQGWSIKPTT